MSGKEPKTPAKQLAAALRIQPSDYPYIRKDTRRRIAQLLEEQEKSNEKLLDSEKKTRKKLAELKTALDNLSGVSEEKEGLLLIQEELQKENSKLITSLTEEQQRVEFVKKQLNGTLKTTAVLISFCDANRQLARTFFCEESGVQISDKDFKKILGALQNNLETRKDEDEFNLEEMFASLMIGGDYDKEPLSLPNPVTPSTVIGDQTVVAQPPPQDQ